MQPSELAERKDDLQVVDVREPFEWEAGHIEGALHVPMAELADRQGELATDRAIACVCRSGARSAAVTSALRNAGYDAHNVEGGMQAWAAAGLPYVASDGSPGQVA